MKTLITLLLTSIYLSGISQSKQSFIINFNFNKFEITPQSKLKLDSFLQSSPPSSIQKINLYGHCDSVGSNQYNDELSLKRIKTTKEYLTGNNIAENIFDTTRGFGKRVPLNKNSTNEERFLNRRVEIIIERKSDKAQAIIADTAKIQDKTLLEKIRDTTTKAGTNLILKNLNFVGGRHWLLPQSKPALDELLQVMQQNPTLEIEIQGHICCEFGPDDGFDEDTHTRNLSVNRAKAIYDYLVQNNINQLRLSYKGFGHQFPLYPEDSYDHQLLNRRVEIKIIKR